MVNANEWKSERERYDAAWAKYQNVAERIDAVIPPENNRGFE